MKELIKESEELKAKLQGSQGNVGKENDHRILTLSKEIERLNVALVNKEDARRGLEEALQNNSKESGRFMAEVAELKNHVTHLTQ